METISLRIKYLIKLYFRNNNVKFAEAVGTSEANVRNYLKGMLPKVEFIVKTCEYLKINSEWLLTGQGEMVKVPATQNENSNIEQSALVISLQNKVIANLEKDLASCLAEKKIQNDNRVDV